MRGRRLLAALLLCCLLPGFAAFAEAAPDELESVPLYIDGLLSARAYQKDGACFLPLRALCLLLGETPEWKETDGSLTLTIGPLTVTGKRAQSWMEAEGRCLWAPEGWLKRGEELYLPLGLTEKLFAVTGSFDGKRCELSTDTLALLRGGEDYYALNFAADELYWLCRIIHAEAGGEPLAGKIGVGNVVMNRVKSPDFPNSLFEVIFDASAAVQFEPLTLDGIQDEEPGEESVLAAHLVLEGANTVGESLFFVNPAAYRGNWFESALVRTVKIGRHQFYIPPEKEDSHAGTDSEPGL